MPRRAARVGEKPVDVVRQRNAGCLDAAEAGLYGRRRRGAKRLFGCVGVDLPQNHVGEGAATLSEGETGEGGHDGVDVGRRR